MDIKDNKELSAEEKRIAEINKQKQKGGKKFLQLAKQKKNDEFYTQLSDIEKELKFYKNKFRGKKVFLNCDDPSWSNFWKYFYNQFEYLGLKSLVSTHYKDGEETYSQEAKIKGGKLIIETKKLKEGGDFRSDECIEILKDSDIVVTNPPFSLWIEYVAQLIHYKKKFIIIGPVTGMGYKDIFPLIKEGKMFIGNSGRVSKFTSYDNKDEVVKTAAATWYTNLNVNSSKPKLDLVIEYELYEGGFEKYDNLDAINVNDRNKIPMDYYGMIGVPITYLEKHDPETFEIISFRKGNDGKDLMIDGKTQAQRIIIQRKK